MYKPFKEVFKTETDESAMPSLKTLKDRSHKIPFNPAKQHATSTMLTVKCAECSKPRLVYAARKISASGKKNFHIMMGSALFTCGALLAVFKSIDLNTKKLDKLFARANLSCIKPVEALYYTLNYPERFAHRFQAKPSENSKCIPSLQTKQGSKNKNTSTKKKRRKCCG